jgi:hypothetical protein
VFQRVQVMGVRVPSECLLVLVDLGTRLAFMPKKKESL